LLKTAAEFLLGPTLLIPGKTLLLVAAPGALGAGLVVGVPALHTWLGGDGSKPAPPPVLDVRFIPWETLIFSN